MASVAVAHHHRNQYHTKPKHSCRAYHSLESSQFINSHSKTHSVSKPAAKNPTFIAGFACCELWAGPAFSNSPPPSSLPIPKFSICSKPIVSLDSTSSSSNDSATQNLRRILNLDP